MATLIKKVRGKNIVEFDKGKFDDWCVYLTRLGKRRYAPTDYEYFTIVQQFGAIYGRKKVYADFIAFYIPTNSFIDPKVTGLITDIADEYGSDAEEVDIWFSVIYAGMVAEENKQFAVLKKRVKRLGLHQVLVEGLDPGKAAVYSKGVKWRELDKIMKERGF